MKNLRRDFERFCYRHQNMGIPNLMLYLVIGTVIVYFFMMIDPSNYLYFALNFNRSAILHGQVWRLFSYIVIPSDGNVLLLAISLYFYYYIGRMLENAWGPFRFNLFYLSGVLIMDIAALLLGRNASISYLNLSLFLAFATLYPENQVLLFFVIPIKMKYLAWFYFGVTIFQLIGGDFFPLFAILNYFLFFGSDILNVLPDFMRPHGGAKPFGGFQRQKPNPNWAKGYTQKKSQTPDYRHKCTVCGRTDVSNPELEFRYCSKCSGYHCYCMDHINNHPHIP